MEVQAPSSFTSPSYLPQPIPGLTAEEAVGFLNFLVTREGIPVEAVAQRIRDCLTFLRTCAAEPDCSHVPSRPVDQVWHGMILHTRWYPRVCQALGSDFIHHRPDGWSSHGQAGEDCRDGGCGDGGGCDFDIRVRPHD